MEMQRSGRPQNIAISSSPVGRRRVAANASFCITPIRSDKKSAESLEADTSSCEKKNIGSRRRFAAHQDLFPNLDDVLSCSCTAVLVVNSTNNFSLRTNKRANWVHSPSDDEHHRYAKQLLDYAKHTFRSAICPQGLNQQQLAPVLGVSNGSFSKYLNAKLGKAGVGKVERALDGPPQREWWEFSDAAWAYGGLRHSQYRVLR